MAKDIKLYRGYADHTLDMTEDGRSKVVRGRQIKWKIENEPNATSLEIVEIISIVPKTGSSFEIFDIDPHRIDNTEWAAKLRNDPDVRGLACEYHIHWLDKSGRPHDHDPIISVRPLPLHDGFVPLPKLIIGVTIGFLTMIALKYLLNTRKKI